MTRPTREQYEQALARANEEKIAVVSEGKWLNGYEFVVVQNPVHSSSYIVTKLPHALACTCKAGEHGNYCKHRAKAHDHWVAKKRLQAARHAFVFKNVLPDRYAGKYW